MDDLKLYGKNDKEIDALIKTVWQCSKDKKMEFSILKCAVVSRHGFRVSQVSRYD